MLFAGNSGDWAGNHVAIRHGDGKTTMSSHMSSMAVRSGQSVQAGQVIGYVGQTGRAFGAHLHFELYPVGVRYGDVYKAINPQPWLRRQRRADQLTLRSTRRRAYWQVGNAAGTRPRSSREGRLTARYAWSDVPHSEILTSGAEPHFLICRYRSVIVLRVCSAMPWQTGPDRTGTVPVITRRYLLA